MATVLILATDHLIGGLLGQLTELAGHSAQFRRGGDEASDAVRKTSPDVVLVDAAYGRTTLDLAAEAARSVGAQVVYFASTLSTNELRRFAFERGARVRGLQQQERQAQGPHRLGRRLAVVAETSRVTGRLRALAQQSPDPPLRRAEERGRHPTPPPAGGWV